MNAFSAATSVTFDTHGVPSGQAEEAMWLAVAQGLLESLERTGQWNVEHEVYSVLTPTASEALDPDAVQALRAHAAGRDGYGTAYGIVRLLTYPDSGRASLAGLTAPAGTAALIAVSEAWMSLSTWVDAQGDVDLADLLTHPEKATRTLEMPTGMPMTRDEQTHVAASRGQVDSDHRPSMDPDRIEVRQALVVRPDGTARSYVHRRGTRVTEPGGCIVVGGPGSPISIEGVIVDLLRRALGVDVDPDVTVGEVLGRGVLGCLGSITAAIGGSIAHSPGGTMRQTAEMAVAAIIDSLETTCPDGTEPGTLPALLGSPGRLTGQLESLQAVGSTGPLYREARQIARGGWNAFLACDGARRWIGDRGTDEPLNEHLWDWYGPGHLSRMADESMPGWGDAVERLSEVVGASRTREVLDVLSACGWVFTPIRREAAGR